MTNIFLTLSRRWVGLALSMYLAGAALAGPGAHGPGGEHIDVGSNASGGAQSAQPRFEVSTELFELVAVLGGGELSMLIDRFDNNAPVLGARVEVEAAGRKAEAKFHSDHGDYAIDDPALVAALSKPGEHAVVISVIAGENSDLLNATLVVGAAGARASTQGHVHDEHDHDHELERWVWIGSGIAGLGALIYLIRRWRRRSALAATGSAQ